MATVILLYRSKKDFATLDVKLQFWIGDRKSRNSTPDGSGKDKKYSDYKGSYKSIQILAKTEKIFSKVDWEKYVKNKNKNSRDSDILKIKKEISQELEKLQVPILEKFTQSDKTAIDKLWLQNIVQNIYHPNQVEADEIVIPLEIVHFIDYFKVEKVLNSTMAAKYDVLKNRLQKFEVFRAKTILFADFNLALAYELSSFYKSQQIYMDNTLQRDFGYIASLCIYAKRKGIHVNGDWVDFKYSKIKKTDLFLGSAENGSDKIFYEYFNFDEIKIIADVADLSESLMNVRDWLLISLWTGQRISDWMRFNKSMIVESRKKKFIKFVQMKTGNEMMIYVNDKLQDILNKRGGDFPKPIAFQKYNDYVKHVAKKAGFTEKVFGYKDQVLENLGKRRVYGEYERWQLISSHIGRRSFATNFYKKIPTYDVMFMTGHKTESEFLRYINETSEDRAHDIADKYHKFFE